MTPRIWPSTANHDRSPAVGFGADPPRGEARRDPPVPTRRAASRSGRPPRACASTTPVTPLPPWLSNFVTARQRACLGGTRRHGAADRMLRRVLQSACQPQHSAPDASSATCTDATRHPAGRHRAGLVQHDGVDAPRRLQHLRALDQDAELGATTGAHQQRGRRGQTQRARAGDDQDRDGGGEGGGRRCADQQPAGQRQQRTAR